MLCSSFSFEKSTIDSKTAGAIAEALKTNTFVTDIKQSSIVYLRYTVTFHSFGENGFGAQEARAIGEALNVNSTITSIK